MPTIGIAIPCYKGHISILKELLDSIEYQTRKPDMVIISCSSASDSDISYKQEQYSFPFKIYTYQQKMNAAQNRNIAASKLQTDIISFIDADDQMHPQRLEIIEKAFNNNIVILLHNYTSDHTLMTRIYDIDKVNFDIAKLSINTWGYGAKHIEKYNADIHNSQASILRSITNYVKYSESNNDIGKEDSVYTAEIIRTFGNLTAYCELPLSKYIASSSYVYLTK